MIRKKLFSLFLCLLIVLGNILPIYASSGEEQQEVLTVQEAEETANEANLGLLSKAVVLMEASTGTVIYEQNPDEKLSPASITKIMTLILIFDALEEGRIGLGDSVTTSAHAKSMGGSQVFLEEGEVQTVETMIKCIIVSSGNDASVAMAEHLAGSETEFISQMNKRAQGLGMTNTNFEDCCGLTDSSNHYTSAKDVAIMSRELITKYPKIFEYSTIWMENITHVTAKGSSEFGLANTNKLLKQYEWTTGLKTGSTSKAKYCLSATARKNDIDLIAVIMAAPDYKVRFSEAISLLNYGYANCKLYKALNDDELPEIPISGGIDNSIQCDYADSFAYLSTTGENVDGIVKEIELEEDLVAPVHKGDVVGRAVYYLDGKEVGSVDIEAANTIEKAGYGDYLKSLLKKMWL